MKIKSTLHIIIYIGALMLLCSSPICAQTLKPAPRLVVCITVDELRSDYLDLYSPFYGTGGFRRLFDSGCVYERAECGFSPVDAASSIATIATGATPELHGIVAKTWLDRTTLLPVECTQSSDKKDSPAQLTASTVADELKISTQSAALVYSVAADKHTAILQGGHAANAAFYADAQTKHWTTAPYYPLTAQKFINAYRAVDGSVANNTSAARLAAYCLTALGMGLDDTTDMLFVGLSAHTDDAEESSVAVEETYRGLDAAIENIINTAEKVAGIDKTLFVLTGNGAEAASDFDYSAYKVPTGTFYINRTANLLNMFLGAIYGQGKYVTTCYHNQIYLNRPLIEQRTVSFPDLMARAKEFLVQNAGVMSARSARYNPAVSGDIIVDVTPGWKLLNEETGEHYTCRVAHVPFPIVLYGADVKPGRVSDLVSLSRIAPTIARAIRVRTPNACSSDALQ